MAPSPYLINPRSDAPFYFGAEVHAAWGFGSTVLLADAALATVAALAPPDFAVTLCDEGISPVDFDTPSEFIGITGKISQETRMIELAREFRRRGKIVIVGGPYASLSPGRLRDECDILVQGEYENIAGKFFSDLRSGVWQREYIGDKPDLRESPIPRWDLYPNHRALSGTLQTSRGCPFECEFCDVIQYLGRKQRHKSPEQVLTELDELYRHGYRIVFLADDNLTVYRARAKELLRAIRDWNDTRTEGRVSFSTQGFHRLLARSRGYASDAALPSQEWTGNELHLFVPEMAKIDQDKDKRLAQLAVTLGEAVSVHAAATTLLESQDWDFSAVWYGAVDRACELFPAGTDEIYKDVVSGVYRFLDLFLGRLKQLAGSETVVMLVSDRTAGESEWRASTGREPKGLLCATGPGIQPDELTFGAGLLDIAPTILGVFGFAPAPEMAGRAISEICATTPSRKVQKISCTTPVPQDTARVASDMAALEEFGYTDTVATAWRQEAEAARTRRDFYLARVLLSQGRFSEAIPLLEKLAAETPVLPEMRLYLGHAYFLSGRIPECRAICEALLTETPDSPFASAGRAHVALAEGNYEEALTHLASGQKAYGMVAALDAAVGEAYLKIGKHEDAAAAFRSALQTDAGIPAAHEGLARALLGLGQHSEAAEAALDAIRLRYDLPGAHNVLGRALQGMGREEAAAGAFANAEMLSRRLPVA